MALRINELKITEARINIERTDDAIMRNLSISTRLMLVIVFMLVLALANFGVLTILQQMAQNDGAVIDASGRNRMLSQRIGFYAEQVVRGNEEEKPTLRDIIELHDQSFYALKNGGIAPGIANDRILPPANAQILPLVLEAEALWVQYKAQAYTIVNEPAQVDGKTNPQVSASLEYIEANGPEMLKLNNAVVAAYVQTNDRTSAIMAQSLAILLALSLLATGVGYVIVRSVSRPLKQLTAFAEEIGAGNLDAKLPTPLLRRKDEIGEMARAFNTLIKNSHTALKTLVKARMKKGMTGRRS